MYPRQSELPCSQPCCCWRDGVVWVGGWGMRGCWGWWLGGVGRGGDRGEKRGHFGEQKRTRKRDGRTPKPDRGTLDACGTQPIDNNSARSACANTSERRVRMIPLARGTHPHTHLREAHAVDELGIGQLGVLADVLREHVHVAVHGHEKTIGGVRRQIVARGDALAATAGGVADKVGYLPHARVEARVAHAVRRDRRVGVPGLHHSGGCGGADQHHLEGHGWLGWRLASRMVGQSAA